VDDAWESTSDAELVTAARRGDRDAYARLFERHQQQALRFAATLTRGPQSADLVAEAFAKILGQFDRGLGPQTNFRAYLLTTIRNLHVDLVRRGSSREAPTADLANTATPSESIQDGAQERAESEMLARALGSLPERWREVLWRAEVDGEPLDSIAQSLGSNRNAIGVLSFRAREGLRVAYLAEHLASADRECQRHAKDVARYVRGTLPSRRADAVRRHLDTCEHCRAALLDLDALDARLGAALLPVGLVVGTGAGAGVAHGFGWLAQKFGLGARLGKAASGTQSLASGLTFAVTATVVGVAGVVTAVHLQSEGTARAEVVAAVAAPSPSPTLVLPSPAPGPTTAPSHPAVPVRPTPTLAHPSAVTAPRRLAQPRPAHRQQVRRASATLTRPASSPVPSPTAAPMPTGPVVPPTDPPSPTPTPTCTPHGRWHSCGHGHCGWGAQHRCSHGVSEDPRRASNGHGQ